VLRTSFICLLFLLPACAFGEPDVVYFHSVPIHLDDAKMATVARLKKVLEATCVNVVGQEEGLCNAMLISTRGTPPSVLGTIYFESGVVHTVSRQWADSETTAQSLAQMFYELIRANTNGTSRSVITTKDTSEPGFEDRRVSVQIGKKEISLGTAIFKNSDGSRSPELRLVESVTAK
jgi:hypothetical protein